MPKFFCIRCARHTTKPRCPVCGMKTAKKLDKKWTQIVGTRFGYDDMKLGIDEYPKTNNH